MTRTRRRQSSKGSTQTRTTGNQIKKIHKKRSRSKRSTNANAEMAPVRVSKSSIHSHWKKELGGIIRYYVNRKSEQNMPRREAEEEIERMYYKGGCSINETKEAILAALGHAKDVQENWVNLLMMVEKDGLVGVPSDTETETESIDRKGLKLPMEQRRGEGPAHSHEQWTNVIVPEWAVGKGYFFQVENNTGIDLSCEIFIDQHQVAKNAPLPKHSKRTIRPDNSRYFERHKWVLQPANRVKLDSQAQTQAQAQIPAEQEPEPENNTRKRYNGTRPNYNGKRVDASQYPDPTAYGWTFTGSAEQSYVEFFERRENMGIIKLDFYYTTATVKTVLDHPTTGKNQLFRNTVSSDEFIKILQNPRSHTGRGYRRRENRGDDMDVNMNVDGAGFDPSSEDADIPIQDGSSDTEMKVDETGDDETTYYAKNEGYDFKKDGHLNRRLEMDKMQRNAQFLAWEEAARREYAFVHAKFYISLPKRQRVAYNNSNSSHRRQSGRKGDKKKEALPEQAPVVDLKATESIDLGTKFQSFGPSASRRPGRRSNVKMTRIKGLTDDDEWKGAPLFEFKLYYRAERTVEGNEMDDESDDDEEFVDGLRQMSSLEEYKTEKINQVQQLFAESRADPEEATMALNNCQGKIRLAGNFRDIDELVKIYHDELIKQKFQVTNGDT